jgi:hypothetical protein
LINFAANHTLKESILYAVCGSLCAGVAGVVDVKLLGVVGRLISSKSARVLPRWTGKRFYLLTFLFAFLPLPFSLIRLAMLKHRPRAGLFGLAVVAGRLPRYLLTVYCWQFFELPGWLGIAILVATLALVYFKRVFTRVFIRIRDRKVSKACGVQELAKACEA